MSSYVLVVGFHHKKGTSVEYVYPELETGLDLPPAWNFIPPIALPDGAHNFDKDYIFFTAPSLEQKPTTLFGVACFRQVDARNFSNLTPDLTRNSVQKSVVFLSPAALFGAVCRLLDDVTDDFISASSCEEGYEILRKGFEDIQVAVNRIVRSSSFEDVLLQGLSAVSFVRVYQREALVILKILLLERRVLFACETAVHCMSTWLLTLISLIPGMLNGGLSTCALVDDTWVGERACWPLATLSRSSVFDDGSTNASADVPIVQESNEEFTGEGNSTTPIDFAQSRAGALRTGATSLWSNVTKTASSVLGSRPSPINSTSTTSATIEQPPNSNFSVHQSGSTAPSQAPSSNAAPHDVYSALPPLTDGSVFDCALPTDDWGLPLALFSRSYLFLPYVPLHALDMLLEFRPPSKGDTTPDPLAIGGRRVRGFLCGTTNPLLSQNTRLAEAIVHTLPFPSTEASKVSGGGDLAPQMEGQNLEASGDLEVESTDSGQRVGFPSDPHSSNRTGGVLSRLLNRQQSTIRICPPSTEPGGRLRDLPMPLNRAIQLSRFDRIFIDHLVNTAELWYSAKAAKEVDANVPTAPAGSEEITPRQIAEAEVLAKFPELTDLERWIRDQFSVYIKSLLLASEGRGKHKFTRITRAVTRLHLMIPKRAAAVRCIL
ncbi:unnamed protein product [Hymenolepis diminuta]|uniref:UDENN domain-containing protein n=1 Tax=Hymenolepis diminuta TaxID=6216 RepID=A0A564Z3J8_HYMDI|nr:unnamed protein product [Hymenolepis diminuta]